MKNRVYETLDEFLADLDEIKEEIAKETEGMTPEQVVKYFSKAERELEEKTGVKLGLRRAKKKRR